MKTLSKMALTIIMTLGVMKAMTQPNGRRGDNSTPEQRAKQQAEQLTKELGLNETQQKQVEQLYLKFHNERNNTTRPSGEMTDQQREQMREQMQKRMEDHQKEMKKILTDEQYTKWEKMQKERMQRMQQGRGGRGPQAMMHNDHNRRDFRNGMHARRDRPVQQNCNCSCGSTGKAS